MMESITYEIIGGYKVRGQIKCMGAKNLATKIMLASLLTNEKSLLHNVPNIGEIKITKSLLEKTGAKIKWNKKTNKIIIDPYTLSKYRISNSKCSINRITILLFGILLQKLGRGSVPYVRGDKIGKRNIEFHTEIIKNFGGIIIDKYNKYIGSIKDNFEGCKIKMSYPSVGATENAILLSVLAKGTTILDKVAIEPEIDELVKILCMMGAKIKKTKNRKLIIEGVNKLHGIEYHIIGDRIEAASWALIACASNGNIRISGIHFKLLNNFLPYFIKIGGGINILSKKNIIFYKKTKLRAIRIETRYFPGFSTDYQPLFTIILTQCYGTSTIHETVYENRFKHLSTLNKLGANTYLSQKCINSKKCIFNNMYKHTAIIKGPTKIKINDNKLTVLDIRAGMSYIIASILINKKTILNKAGIVERGYGDITKKIIKTNIIIKRKVSRGE